MFWRTPELRISVGKSRLQPICYGAALLCAGFALYLIADRGHIALAICLFVLSVPGIFARNHDSGAGLILRWHREGFRAGRGNTLHNVDCLRYSLALPWLVYLNLRPTGGGPARHVWLFQDAVDPGQYRRLRACVRLQGEGR